MPDREAVIANIREDIDLLTHDRQPTADELRIINDLSAAVVLLKEQEAVEPQLSISGMWYECPVCHRHLLKDRDNYCARCGKAMNWE